MADDIFLCFGCGKRNRVSPGSNRTAAKCGSCGEPLFPSENPSTKSTPQAGHPKQSPPYQPPAKPKGGVISKIFWISLIGVVGLSIYNAGTGSQKPPKSAVAALAPQPSPAPSLPPAVAQAPGIMWNTTGRPLEAPLRIETSSGADYYVKLINTSTGAAEIAIYIKGGLPLDVEIPLGSYRFRYASGETWRGETHLFGPKNLTSYNEAGDSFDFVVQDGYINGYTVELIRQVGGNLSTRQIDPSQF